MTRTAAGRDADGMSEKQVTLPSAHPSCQVLAVVACHAGPMLTADLYARTLSSAEAPMMFFTCPAYLDQDSALRCGLPAEVACRFTMHSTDGPLESVMIRCPAGHCFTGPIESLNPDNTENHDPSPAGSDSSARNDSPQHGHDDQGGPALRHGPAEPARTGRRPNTAPAYYLGHPAALWITVMRPRHRRSTSRHLIEAAVSSSNPTRDADVLQHS
jgi:hypothetical protein